MNKKLILTLAVLAAAVIAAIIFWQTTPKNTETVIENKTVENEVTEISSEPDAVFNTLKNKNAASVVILAANTAQETGKADRLINKINEDGSIKILAFEIFDRNCDMERLMELANANGKPDAFCVNGQIVEAEQLVEQIKKALPDRE